MYSAMLLALAFVLSILLSIKKNVDGFTRDFTKNIQGFLTLLIISNHLIPTLYNNAILSNLFFNTGAPAVAIFFFISGYGITTNLNNKNYRKDFWKSKIKFVLLPFLMANILYSLIFIVFGSGSFNLFNVLNLIQKGEFIASFSWYIVSLLYLYFVSFSSNKIKNQKIYLLYNFLWYFLYFYIIRYVFKWSSNWYITYLAYPMGIFFAKNKEKIEFKSVFLYFGIIMNIVLYILELKFILNGDTNSVIYVLLQTISSLSICYITYALSYKITIKNSIFSFINTFGLEVYLYHGLIIQILKKINIIYSNNYSYILFTYLFSIAIAFTINKVYHFIMKRTCKND